MSEHEERIRHRHHWRWDFPACQECGGSLTCAVCDEHTRIDRYIAEAEAENAALREMLQLVVTAADASYVDIRPFAGPGHSKIVGPFQDAIEQARALLARCPLLRADRGASVS